MPSPEYLSRLGIFSARDVIDEAERNAITAAMAVATPGEGMVWNPAHGDRRVASKRRTEFAGLPEKIHTLVAGAIAGLRPALSAHFGVELTRLQPLKFVRYDVGDFYGVHNDVTDHPDAPAEVRRRKVSVVSFLNDQVDPTEVDEVGGYCGGRLTFHGLSAQEPWRRIGHPLDAEAGLLVAFRPDTVHEVSAITAGSRFTIVTWFE